MPTYEYKREDGTTFEIKQSINDDALETCPETGQKVKFSDKHMTKCWFVD